MTDGYHTITLRSYLKRPSGRRDEYDVSTRVSDELFALAQKPGPERSLIMAKMREGRGRYLTDSELVGPGIFPADALGEQWREDDAARVWEDEQWWDGDPRGDGFIRGAKRLEW